MTSPKTLLRTWNLRPRQQLGQNFLSDPSTAQMIVNRAELSPEDTVVEIGAGLGALTIPTGQVVRQVYALETDGHLIDLLRTELATHNITNAEVIKQDVLRFDFETFARERGITDRLVVMSNLPYNISSQVLVQLVKSRHIVSRAIIMFQKELARRLVAEPGNRDYSRLTVMLRYCSEIRTLATVRASMFYPKPKVDSEILEVRFRERPEHPVADEEFFFKVIKGAFGQRRKTLRNALSGSELQVSPDLARQSLEAADIDPVRRAETLTVPEFIALTEQLALIREA
ncbi:ribosomal RNA small subunit methyltransferase A [Desulfonema ishimotonii]|uniref:Ribosomal RNA small subunit methyltransferase A n=1 Tax=Desulfonema ishimotonii TaxID=45657 RepID=A0A401G2Z2_9BACT|nr:16S rRNA (adenine(1518)-N(6)/adenine(1519)-N(6))-dimethyltransferase RsmA [Desulfonema ishimotonii]GBC63586.1 ribosomal RNA small subunit methyltransferase A [Desulfonema ishimotonii]